MITNEEARDLNKERVDVASKAKAETFLARKNADEARGWFWFLSNHFGQRGIANGPYFDCEANNRLLTEWLESNQLPVSEQNLEQAYQFNKTRLGNPPSAKYERVTDTQKSRVFPQIKGLQRSGPPVYAPFTRDEILNWSTARLRKEMAKGKEHVDAINKILAGQN